MAVLITSVFLICLTYASIVDPSIYPLLKDSFSLSFAQVGNSLTN